MKTIFIGFLVIGFALMPAAHGRITRAWRYQEMFDKADLVVIGRVVTTRNTDEHSTLLGLKVIGVVTDVRAHLVLKGNSSIKTFRLHHYTLESPHDEETIANGPNLIKFSREHSPCLLFLVKERDGRYAPVTGQEDPALHAVLELEGTAD
jgi:hypothetical protein